MENGAPVYTDLIKNNEKYSLRQMVSQYSKPNGPYEADERRNWNTFPEQDEAVKVWAKTDAEKHILPGFLTPTAEESKELGKILTEVSNYKEEMFVKFIVGKEPMESYDKYVEQIKKLGLNVRLRSIKAPWIDTTADNELRGNGAGSHPLANLNLQ